MIGRLGAKAWERWVAYWFQPGPTLDLAMLRIAVVGFQLWSVANLHYFQLMSARATLPAALWDPPYFVSLLTLPFAGPPPLGVVVAVYWVSILAGVLSLIGLSTRINLWVFAMSSLFCHAYISSWGDFHHPRAATYIVLFFLAAGPSGASLSIDDLRRRIRSNAARSRFQPRDVAAETDRFATWPVKLVCWLFSLIYLSAALSKLLTGKFGSWLNGYTLQYYLVQDGLRWGSSLGVWVGQFHWVALVASYMSVFWEGLFWTVLVWRPLALIFVPAGVAFHTSVYMLQRAPFFNYFALYAAFVPFARCTRWLRERVRRRNPERPDLLYDGLCSLCIRSVTVLQYFDWFDRLVYTNLESPGSSRSEIALEDARREMHILLPDGEILRGYFSIRRALWQLPAFWPLLPFLYLPLAAQVGPWIYNKVASARARFSSCDSGTCAFHRP